MPRFALVKPGVQLWAQAAQAAAPAVPEQLWQLWQLWQPTVASALNEVWG